jgi:hypothetical protein
MPHHTPAPATDSAPATVATLAGGLGHAFGGMLLWLQAAVVIPTLIPGVALTVLLLLPFIALAVVATVVVGLPLGAVRLATRARRRRTS